MKTSVFGMNELKIKKKKRNQNEYVDDLFPIQMTGESEHEKCYSFLLAGP